MTAPLPGTIGLTMTPDVSGAIIRAGLRSKINHAYVVLTDGKVFEARPSGAGIQQLANYPRSSFRDDIALSDVEREAIMTAVLGLIGTPYGWLDIAALSYWVFSGHRVPAGVQRRIEDTGTLICSQLVDRVYHNAGIILFDDGRLPGAVTSQDLVTCLPQGRKI